MKCPDALTIQSFVDGELSADAAAVVRQHIEECAQCRMLAQQLQATHGALSSVGSVTAPAGLFDSIERAVRTEAEGIGCGTAHELISASLDHELTDEQAVGLAEHLADCPDCTYYAKSMGVLVQLLHSVEQVAPPEGLRERIERAVASIRKEAGVFHLLRKRWKTGAAVVATAAAAAAIILALIFHGGQPAPTSKPAPAPPQIVEEATPDLPTTDTDVATPEEEISDTAVAEQPSAELADTTEAIGAANTPPRPQPSPDTRVASRVDSEPSDAGAAAEEPKPPSEASGAASTVAERPEGEETIKDSETSEHPAADSGESQPARRTEIASARSDMEVSPLLGTRPVDLERKRARDITERIERSPRDFKKSDIAEKPVAVAMVMESGPTDLPKSAEARLSKARPDSSEAIVRDSTVATPASYPPSAGGGNWLPSSEPDKSVYRASADSNKRLIESGRRISESIENLRDEEPRGLLLID